MKQLFLLQDEKENPLKIELAMLKNELISQDNKFEYFSVSLSDFTSEGMGRPCNYPKYWRTAIPVGSIEFISAWLKTFYGTTPNPIEIPKCLLKPEFLKREYKIVPFSEIPKSGSYFVKDVSKLKSFNSGMISDLSQIDFDLISSNDYKPDDVFGLEPIDKTHLFQVSERLNILAEYRVYFIDGKLFNICNYNGDISFYPDVNLLKKANMIYSFDKNYPISYTMDVMVSNKGTSIIEIHPFASIGLYATLWGNYLPYAYIDGINYYIDHNISIEKTL